MGRPGATFGVLVRCSKVKPTRSDDLIALDSRGMIIRSMRLRTRYVRHDSCSKCGERLSRDYSDEICVHSIE